MRIINLASFPIEEVDRVTPDVMGNGNTGNSGNSKEVIALGGNSTGNTYTHEEPSDSKGSSQAVTGVTSVTGDSYLI